MRKLIALTLMAAAAMPAAAYAQTREEIRHDRREVQQERRDLREARQELRENRADRNRVRYAAPYRNWIYSPVRAGYQLRPAFYSNRYFVSDYSRRGLRQPGRYQRWIRYGDGLLLVNERNGRVIQTLDNRY